MQQRVALAITLAIELPVALAVVRWRRIPVSTVRLLAVAAVCSLLSHPFAWAANHTIGWSFWPRAALIETGVVVFEALVYGWLVPLRPRVAWGASLLANSLSFGAGLVWWWLSR